MKCLICDKELVRSEDFWHPDMYSLFCECASSPYYLFEGNKLIEWDFTLNYNELNSSYIESITYSNKTRVVLNKISFTIDQYFEPPLSIDGTIDLINKLTKLNMYK